MITGEEVKQAMIAAGIERVDHHDCGMCHYMTQYVRQEDVLYFDAGCDCGAGRNVEARSWDSAADWINMQSGEGVKQKLMKAFGISDDILNATELVA